MYWERLAWTGLRFRTAAIRVTMAAWRAERSIPPEMTPTVCLPGPPPCVPVSAPAVVTAPQGKPYREAIMVLCLLVPVLMLGLLIGMDLFEERLFRTRPSPPSSLSNPETAEAAILVVPELPPRSRPENTRAPSD
ncbi:hypothetical protein ACWD5V_16635 [Streptomyces sp. NPDC002523]